MKALTPALFCLAAAFALPVQAQTWTSTASGNWNDINNWNNGAGPIPNGVDAAVIFEQTPGGGSGNLIITNDLDPTVGSLATADDPTTNPTYWIQGGTLTLQTSAGTPSVTITGQNLRISSVIQGNQGFTFSADTNFRRLQLEGNNTYTGQTINNGGNFIIGNANALGATGVGNETVLNAGGINFGGSNRTIGEDVIFNGGGLTFDTGSNGATATLTGTMTLQLADNTITARAQGQAGATTVYDFQGTIQGAGNLNLTSAISAHSGTFILSGNNTFAGQTRITQGGGGVKTGRVDVAVGHDNALSGGNLVITGGVQSFGFGSADANTRTVSNSIDYDGGNDANPRVFTFGSIGSGDLILDGDFAMNNTNNRTFEVLNNTTINGVLSQDNGAFTLLTKTGSGTLTLGGTNTYTAATQVDAGELSVTGSIVGDVTTAAGTVLSGDGSIGGQVTVNGSVRPGQSIGTLSVGNGLIWNEGEDWSFELGTAGSSDLVAITGDFTKGTGSSFTFDFLGTGEAGTYTLIDWSGVTNFSEGDFAFTNLGGSLSGSFTINGTQLDFTAVPEPTTGILLLAGGALLTLRRRGRHSCGLERQSD